MLKFFLKSIARLGWIAIFLLIVATLVNLFGCSNTSKSFNSIDITGVDWGKKFVLNDINSNKVDLSKFNGKVVTLFFGFLSCPDFCPNHLNKMVYIKESLENKKKDLIVIFVSVDPERDTKTNMKNYLASFDSDFIGVIPSIEQLEDLKKEFKLVVNKVEQPNSESYTIDHYTYTYIYDKKNNLRLLSPFNISQKELLLDISLLL